MLSFLKGLKWSMKSPATAVDSKLSDIRTEEEAAAWHERAQCTVATGDFETALCQAGHAVRLAPCNMHYRRQLASVLRQLECYTDAIRLLEEGLCFAGDDANKLRLEIGEIYLDAADLEAVARVIGELTAKGGVFESSLLAGRIALRQKDWKTAKSELLVAAGYCPNDFRAWNALGAMSIILNELMDARCYLERAIAITPTAWQAYTNLALVAEHSNELAQAAEFFEKAIRINPHEERTRFNAALLNLKRGDFKKGWLAYESRFKVPEIQHLLTPRVENFLWDGGDLVGKDILVLSEQGYGDQIQFSRYLPLLEARGARVHYVCPPALVRLFESLSEEIKLYPDGADVPDLEVQCALMSLPLLMGTETTEMIPAKVPYLRAPTADATHWKTHLAGYEGKRIGLVWASNTQDGPFRDRRLSIADFEPLWVVPGHAIFSLQIGRGADEVLPVNLIDLADSLHDFADTAAIMAALDLVITVDTAAAHLAGALGRRVWLLLPEAAEWRWMVQREDSPWYPTMKIFRRKSGQSWQELVAMVADALAAEID
jgi:tetratricopeptide (TPR) repeat protein